jgi:hypothetical protein
MRKLLAIVAALGVFAAAVPMQASAAPAARPAVGTKAKTAVVRHKHKRHARVAHRTVRQAKLHGRHKLTAHKLRHQARNVHKRTQRSAG